jgi:hypothetical protein
MDKHGGIIMSTKPSMMGQRSRYTSRKLLDGAHGEAEELWDYSGWKSLGMSSEKNSILNYVTLGQKQSVESLPYSTFKGGKIPHAYNVMSICENPEPTSAPINPNLSPLEFASLQNMSHVLPKDYLHDKENATVTTGRDDLMRYGKARKWKTSYAKKSSAKVPYARTDITTANVATTAQAQMSAAGNKALAGADPDDPSKTGQQSSRDATTTKAWNALSRHLLRLLRKMTAGYLKGMSKPYVQLNDPDLIGLINSGANYPAVQSYIASNPTLQQIPGINYVLPVLAQIISGGLEFAQWKKNKGAKAGAGGAPGGAGGAPGGAGGAGAGAGGAGGGS